MKTCKNVLSLHQKTTTAGSPKQEKTKRKKQKEKNKKKKTKRKKQEKPRRKTKIKTKNSNPERSVSIVKILQSKSKSIMSKKEKYLFISFCLKNNPHGNDKQSESFSVSSVHSVRGKNSVRKNHVLQSSCLTKNNS